MHGGLCVDLSTGSGSPFKLSNRFTRTLKAENSASIQQLQHGGAKNPVVSGKQNKVLLATD